MDDGVELKQLTVGVDSVGLGVGAGLASAIVLMAISAASVVIVFIIYCLSIVGGRLVVIAGQPLWQSKRNLLWGLGGYFSPSSPRTAAGSSRNRSSNSGNRPRTLSSAITVKPLSVVAVRIRRIKDATPRINLRWTAPGQTGRAESFGDQLPVFHADGLCPFLSPHGNDKVTMNASNLCARERHDSFGLPSETAAATSPLDMQRFFI